MRSITAVCVLAIAAAGPAVAEDPEGNLVTDEEIRSGLIIDDGLDIPHIRPGTQYFEIHGSTRIARALGDHRLPTDSTGLHQPEEDEPWTVRRAAAW